MQHVWKKGAGNLIPEAAGAERQVSVCVNTDVCAIGGIWFSTNAAVSPKCVPVKVP